ncbi:hypothetical protein MARBORIA2_14070 [Methanobrevibacter arboriphilus]|nr:hypothetical protein MARBORIA2_14070 [Methanobrevibacter arboriphilus]
MVGSLALTVLIVKANKQKISNINMLNLFLFVIKTLFIIKPPIIYFNKLNLIYQEKVTKNSKQYPII